MSSFLAPGWMRFLLVILVLLSLSQWVLILPLVVESKVLTSLDSLPVKQSLSQAGTLIRAVPFAEDFFFFAWNAFPVVLYLSYLFMSAAYAELSARAERRFRVSDDGLARNRHLQWHVVLVLFAVAVCISILAVYAQFDKQETIRRSGEFIYWWDDRINPTIFLTRLVFLVPNVILIAIVLGMSAWWLIQLNRLALNNKFRPLISDPHQAFGSQSFADLLGTAALPWFFAIIIGLLGWVDHAGRQGVFNLLGSALLGVFGLVGMILILRPLLKLWNQLLPVKQDVLGKFEKEIDHIDQQLINPERHHEAGVLTVAANRHWEFVQMSQHVAKSRTLPTPGVLGLPALAGLLTPFISAIGVGVAPLVDLLVKFFQ